MRQAAPIVRGKARAHWKPRARNIALHVRYRYYSRATLIFNSPGSHRRVIGLEETYINSTDDDRFSTMPRILRRARILANAAETCFFSPAKNVPPRPLIHYRANAIIIVADERASRARKAARIYSSLRARPAKNWLSISGRGTKSNASKAAHSTARKRS